MKVLFIAWPLIGHYIPLLSLNARLRGSGVETAFLVPGPFQGLLRLAGANVLKTQFGGLSEELQAYREFAPDVVVDDGGIWTGHATRLTKVKRVALQRTGSFPGYVQRNESHQNSGGRLSEFVAAMPDVTYLGLEQPRTFSDLLKADINIVPGISSIEPLPESLRDDPAWLYSGPLLVDDSFIIRLAPLLSQGVAGRNSADPSALRRFYEATRGRRKIFVTMGTVAQSYAPLLEALRRLLREGYALTCTFELPNLSAAERELCYYAPYLPLNFVCSNSDLVIHHCGSGTYHYPLLHGIPSIAVGTQCYDRDDVAARLQELGAARYLPSPAEEPDFVNLFEKMLRDYTDEESALVRETKARISILRAQIEETARSFDFESVLRRVTA